MDITNRINLSLALLLVILTVLMATEFFKDKKKNAHAPSPLAAVQIITPSTAEVKKIFSGSAGEEYQGLTVSSMETFRYIKEERPVPTENFKVKSVFTKTKRGAWLAPPEGFFSALTNNYLIYRERLEITPELRRLLEKIHGNFVLDIVPFSLFSKFNRVFLMLFRTKESYSTYTSKPSWSIATTDIEAQAVYMLENDDFEGNFVHELTHIYFDGFFAPQISPLWLSEGFAVYMQSKAQLPQDTKWLRRNIESFRRGEYIDFEEFINTESLREYPKNDVVMWYAQAYSVVDFLLKDKSRDEFYQFCKNIKEGMPLGRALYRAYGMPFNTPQALEYAWQADLQRDLKLIPAAQEKTTLRGKKK